MGKSSFCCSVSWVSKPVLASWRVVVVSGWSDLGSGGVVWFCLSQETDANVAKIMIQCLMPMVGF